MAVAPSWLVGDRVVILDLDSGKVLHTLTEHRGTVAGVSLTPDATRVITVGYRDNQVLVWDLEKGSILHKMHHENGVHSVVAMPDGARFITSGFDGTLRIWDLATGKELRRMPTPSGEGAALAVSPDGRLLLAAWSESIWVWDLVSFQVVARMTAPGHEVFALAFAPDGKRFVSTGFDRTVRIWQLPRNPGAACRRRGGIPPPDPHRHPLERDSLPRSTSSWPCPAAPWRVPAPFICGTCLVAD